MNLAYQFLKLPAEHRPEATALIADETLTFRELEERTERIAAKLIAAGVSPGDRIGFMMNNTATLIAVYFAILRVGAVAVAINVMLQRDEINFLVDDAGCRAVFCDAEAVERLVSVRDRVPSLQTIIVVGSEAGSPVPDGAVALDSMESSAGRVPVVDRAVDDIALLFYTSGTTGLPKGVMLTHYWVDYTMTAWAMALKLRASDRMFTVSPFFYALGMIAVLIAFRVSASVVMLGRFQARAVLDALTTYEPTVTLLVPTVASLTLDQFDPARDRVNTIRTLVLSGGGHGAELHERIEQAFETPVRGVYGLTEAHLLAAGAVGMPLRPGVVGPTGGNVEVRIVDDNGNDVAQGQVGEIICRGDTVASGYWGQPEATAAAFRDGWFLTGDLGVQDEAGYLSVVGRRKEMIVVGGANVYPAEVDNLMLGHPDVSQATLVGIPDETYGELPVAALVLQAGARITESEFIAYCRERLAAYKCPRRVVFLDSLPATASGKVARGPVRDTVIRALEVSSQ